jgi:ankyrin repeat protein
MKQLARATRHRPQTREEYLWEAVVRGRSDDVQAILIKEAGIINIDQKDEWDRTPLNYSSEHGPINAVRLLLEHGADVNSGNVYGRTPLHLACKKGNYDIAQLLIDHHAIVDSADRQNGTTPLMLACAKGHIAVAKLLLEHDAAVNHQETGGGRSALHRAVFCQCKEIVQLLLKYKASILIRNKQRYGQTPLHCAFQPAFYIIRSQDDYKNLLEIVTALLLDSGSNSGINIKDKVGKTPLHYAVGLVFTNCHNIRIEVVKCLVAIGYADIHVKDNDDQTPLDLARKRINNTNNIDYVNYSTSIVEYLESESRHAPIRRRHTYAFLQHTWRDYYNKYHNQQLLLRNS